MALLAPHFTSVVLTRVDFDRGATAEELDAIAGRFPWAHDVVTEVAAALQRATEGPEETVVVTGTLATNVDIGAGYAYGALIEDASVAK